MPIRRLLGTATTDLGVFWNDNVNVNGWRIQYNKTFDKVSPLKPYRLLDPQSNLWASADTLAEINQALPGLIEDCSKKNPLFDSNEAKAFLKKAAEVALNISKHKKLI